MANRMTPARATINHLRLCQQARAAGYPVAYTTDAAWLVGQALSRFSHSRCGGGRAQA